MLSVNVSTNHSCICVCHRLHTIFNTSHVRDRTLISGHGRDGAWFKVRREGWRANDRGSRLCFNICVAHDCVTCLDIWDLGTISNSKRSPNWWFSDDITVKIIIWQKLLHSHIHYYPTVFTGWVVLDWEKLLIYLIENFELYLLFINLPVNPW